MRRLTYILTLALLTACGGGDAARDSGRGERGGEHRPAAAYGRRFLLLSGDREAPFTAVFDFSALDGPNEIRRGAGAWYARGAEWTRLFQHAWTTEPIREPWRLVPYGPIRLIVGDGEEIETLVHRAEPGAFRLSPSGPLAEWSMNDGAQLRLRHAELLLGDARITGILLDLQTAVPDRYDGALGLAFLTDGVGLHLVIARDSSIHAPAWLWQGAENVSWDAVEISTLAADTAGPGWRITEPRDELTGELRVVGSELVLTYPDEALAPTARVSLVDGWLEVRGGERQRVFGVVRHGEE